MDDRIVLHVDMDAFYASVETRDRPELADVPVVIGADPKGGRGRGVASTANYHARRFGIHSAMPISQAYRACPHAVFLPPSFEKYKAASGDVMEVLRTYADVLEVVGMDEAYLDVTQACGSWRRAPSFARSLQAAVKRATGLSCSVGAAATKSIAKIASDHRKPHGVTTVPPTERQRFLAPLPVKLINGCGPKTAAHLEELGYRTIGELADLPEEQLEARFGKHGRWLWNVARGQDDRAVCPDRGPGKSRGNERTFRQDVADHGKVLRAAGRLIDGLIERSRDPRSFATITVKLRYSDFTTLTRARTLSIPLDPSDPSSRALAQATVEALLGPLLDDRAVRLVGVRLSGFRDGARQRSLAAFANQNDAVPKRTPKSSHHRMALR